MTYRFLRWRKVTCPHCGTELAIHAMRLAATCGCGCYFVDVEPFVGWYASLDAFAAGAERITP